MQINDAFTLAEIDNGYVPPGDIDLTNDADDEIRDQREQCEMLRLKLLALLLSKAIRELENPASPTAPETNADGIS